MEEMGIEVCGCDARMSYSRILRGSLERERDKETFSFKPTVHIGSFAYREPERFTMMKQAGRWMY
jgi:hypothetical protein